MTIVTGLARSGTSMMMEMLQAGGVPLLTDGVRQGDQDNPRGYFEFEPVKRFPNDLVWLETAQGRAVKMFYQLFLYGLPDTVRFDVVFMHRDLHEVVASQVRAARNQGLEDLDVNEARLVSAFGRQVRNVEAWLAAQPAFRVLHLDYARVLEDPRSASVAVQDFLGRALDVVAMSQVPDPSLYRQRLSSRRGRAEGQRRSDRP